MVSLNIFANFFIDREERFLRMQDSFLSFKDISADKWVINVRGRYAGQSLDFLRSHLGNRLISYKLHSEEGWFHDTRQMLPDIDGDYVLFWLEDHINISDTKILYSIVEELKENQVDYMYYSFWWDGALRQRYKGIPMNSGVNIDWFDHTVINNPIVQSNAKEGVFIIAACSIFKNKLFRRIVLADDPVQRRWPKETPFDFEKRPTDVHWLPLRVALPRQEFFASIDDDHVHPGSCLISRNLYSCREQRKTYAISNKPSSQSHKKNLLAKLYRRIFS
jgi:hypothetical protein